MTRSVPSRIAWLWLLLACACHPAVRRAPAADPPRRIVSLNPCVDAILLRVADPAQIASISHYSRDPAATSVALALARRFPANDETAEEVVALAPDMVLMGAHVAKPTLDAIMRAGIRVENLAVPMTIGESIAQVREVARLAGHPARGEALARAIEAALAAAAPSPGAAPIPAIIWQGGGLVPGQGTLADELLTRTGYRNLSAAYGLRMWDVLPGEYLVARPPRLIFAGDDAVGQGDGRGLEGPALKHLASVTRVARFPARLLDCAGPNLIPAAARLAAVRDAFARTSSPLPFRGGAGVGRRGLTESAGSGEGPHPNPSPEGEGLR